MRLNAHKKLFHFYYGQRQDAGAQSRSPSRRAVGEPGTAIDMQNKENLLIKSDK